jgi:hypothetical protein
MFGQNERTRLIAVVERIVISFAEQDHSSNWNQRQLWQSYVWKTLPPPESHIHSKRLMAASIFVFRAISGQNVASNDILRRSNKKWVATSLDLWSTSRIIFNVGWSDSFTICKRYARKLCAWCTKL